MRARDLFYGPEKLRALWRVLLFVAGAAIVWTAMWPIAARIVPEDLGVVWALGVWDGLLVVALLVGSFVMMRWLEHKPFVALGFPGGREAPLDFGKGAAIGAGFIVVVVVALTLLGWLRPAPDSGTVVGWLARIVALAVVLTIAAAAEELLLRGYPFQVLVEGAGVLLAVVLTSVAFAATHLANDAVSWVAMLNIGLAGVLFAAAYLRTRSLWVPIGMHWGWNFAMAAFFDLPVSGIFFDMPGYDTVAAGPDLLTGGAFGPEGGLLTTLFIIPLIGWVARTSWLSQSQRMAGLKPLVDSRMKEITDH